MATTLRIESFKNINLRERSSLASPAAAGDDSIQVESTEGFATGQIIYVGTLGREGCERAAVASVSDETTIELSDPLEAAHSAFDAVTAVLGDRIRIYRAPNVTGTPPADTDFSALSSRTIDPDQAHTYFTDSTGSASYWYKATYYNESTTEETPLSLSDAVRGDDYGRYAHLEEIRSAAGFQNAQNLKDYVVDQARRDAEAEINAALSGKYTVPFAPVPEIVRTMTIALAAGLLKESAYPGAAGDALKTVRSQIRAYALGDGSITDEQGADLTTDIGVDGSFGDAGPMFTVEQKF